MERARAAAALLVLAACLACSAAAPVNEQTGLDLYDGGAKEGCYYNFQHYGEGDRIMTNEPCLNCTCHNRMLMCYLRVCPFTKPIGQDCTIEKRGDQCCPVITCPDVRVDLLTSTSTTSPAEYGSSELGHLEKYGCSINDKFYSEGSKVPSTPNKPCELCYCIRNMTACVMQECTLHVDGCTPVYLKDVCCPVRYSCDHTEDEILMLDDMTTTVRPTPGFLLTTTVPPGVTQDCAHDDEVFADGALIKTEKACEHCYCMKGDIVCVVQECGTPMENEGKNCTSLPPREGQCCPDTYICEGDTMVEDTTNDNELLTTYLPARETIPQAEIEGSGYDQPNVPQAATHSPLPEEEQEGSGLESTATVSGEDVTVEHTHYEQTTPTKDLINRTPDTKEPIKPEEEPISKEPEPSEENDIVSTSEKAVEKEVGETPQEEMITSLPSVSLGEPPKPSDQVTEKSNEESPLPVSEDRASTKYTPTISEYEKESTATTFRPMESSPQKESAPKLDEQPIEKSDEKPGEKLSTPHAYEQSTERHEEGPYEPVTEKSNEQTTVKITEPGIQIDEQFTKKPDDQPTDKINEKSPEPIDKQPVETPEEESTEPLPTKHYEQSTEELPITETPAAKSTDNMYVQSTDKLHEQTTEKLDEKPTEKLNVLPTEIPEKSTESNEEATEKVDNKPTEKIDEQSTEKPYEVTSEKTGEIPTEKVDEYSPKIPDEESTVRTEEQSTEKLHDLSTENPVENFTENEQLPEKVYGQSTEKLDEQSTEKLNEQSTKTLEETSTEKVYGQSTEKLGEQSTEKLDEQSTKILEETSTEKVYEQSTEKLDENSISTLNEATSEKADENFTENLDEQSTEKQYEATSQKIYEKATEKVDELNNLSTETPEQSTDKLYDSIENDHNKSTEKLDENSTEKYDQQSTEKLDADSTEEPFKTSINISDERPTETFDEQSTQKLPEQHTEGYEMQPTEKIAGEQFTERPDEKVTPKLGEEITSSSVPSTVGTLLPEPIDTYHTSQTVPSTPGPVEEGSGEPSLSEPTESVEYQQPSSTTTPVDDSEPAGMPHTSPITDNSDVSVSSESTPKETTESLEENVLTTLTPVSEKDEKQDIDNSQTTEISTEEQSTDFEQKETTLSSTNLDRTTPRSINDISTQTSIDKETEIDDAKTNAPSIPTSTTYSEPEFDSSTQSIIEPEMQTTERTGQETSEILPISNIDRTTQSELSISLVTTESNEHPLPTSGPYDLSLDDTSKSPIETTIDIEKTSVPSVLEPEITTVGLKETNNRDQPTESEETSEISTEAPDTSEIIPESPKKPSKETDVGMTTEVTDGTEVTPGITQMSDSKEIDSTSPSVPVTELSPGTLSINETPALSTSTSAPKVESITETTTTSSDGNIVTFVPDLSENEINEEESGMGHILPHIPGEGDCLVDGITYTNDSSIPSTNKCQNSCKCVSSIVKCEPIQCSPPPENMINCQPMYDAKESCCPTYVCDNAKETVPPESHNQMLDLTTELPAIEKDNEPSVIPDLSDIPDKHSCSSEECEAKEEVIVPVKVPELCNSEGCLLTPAQVTIPNRASDETISSEKDKAPLPDCQSDDCTQPIPIVPVVVVAPEECTQESCTPTKKDPSEDSQTPIVSHSDSSSELPVVSCSGEDCDESSSSMSSNLPTDDCKSADCKKPVSTIPSEHPTIPTNVISQETPSGECNGDHCLKPDSIVPETQSSTETLSEVTPTESLPEIISCEGDQCKISPTVNDETKISDECKGGDCAKPALIPSDIPVSASIPCTGYKCDEPKIVTPDISSEECKSGDCASPGSISTEISAAGEPCVGDQCDVPTTAISDISVSEDCKSGDCSPSTVSPEIPTILSCEGEECDKPTAVSSEGPSSEECNDGDCKKEGPSDIPVSVTIPCIGDQCDVPKVVMPESSSSEECMNGNCAPGLTPIDIPAGAPCIGDQCNQPRPLVPESPLSEECKGDDCTPTLVSPETAAGVLCAGNQCDVPTTIISEMPSSDECKGTDCRPGSVLPDIAATVPCTDDQCIVAHTPESQTDIPAIESSTTCKDGECEIPVSITPVIPTPHDITCIGDQCSIPVDTSPHISEDCKSGDCESSISESPNIEIPVDISEGSPSYDCKDAECKKPSTVTSETPKPLEIPCNGKECDVPNVTYGDADSVTSKVPELETTEIGEKDTTGHDRLTTETSVSDLPKITPESNIQTTNLDYELTTPVTEQKEPDSQGPNYLPNEIDDLRKPTEPTESKDSATSTASTEFKTTTERELTESKPSISSIHPIDESSVKPTSGIDEAFNEIPTDSTDDKYGGGSSPTEYLPTESVPIDERATDKTGDRNKPTTSQPTVILLEEMSTSLHNIEEIPTEKPTIDALEKHKEEDIEIPITEEAISSENELTTPKTDIETTVGPLSEEPSISEATTEKIISDVTTSVPINEQPTINNEIQPIPSDTSNEDGAIPTESSSEQGHTTMQELTTAYSVELDEHVHEQPDQEKTETEKPHSEKPEMQEGPSTTVEDMEITTDSVLKEKEAPVVESHIIDMEAPETSIKPEVAPGTPTVDDSAITQEPVLISEDTSAHTISEMTTQKIISTERITEQEVTSEPTAAYDAELSSVSQVTSEQPTEKSDKESVTSAVTESYSGHEPEEKESTTEKPTEEEIIATTETEPKLQTEIPESVTNVPVISSSISNSEPDQHITDIPPHEYETTEISDEKLHDDSDKQTTNAGLHYTVETELGTPDQTESTNVLKETTPQIEEFTESSEEAHKTSISLPSEDANALEEASSSAGEGPEKTTRPPEKEVSASLPVDTTKTEESNEIEPEISEETKPESPERDYITTNVPVITFENDIDQATIKPEHTNVQMSETPITESSDESSPGEPDVTDLPHVSEEHEIQQSEKTSTESPLIETESPYSKSTELVPTAITEPSDLTDKYNTIAPEETTSKFDADQAPKDETPEKEQVTTSSGHYNEGDVELTTIAQPMQPEFSEEPTTVYDTPLSTDSEYLEPSTSVSRPDDVTPAEDKFSFEVTQQPHTSVEEESSLQPQTSTSKTPISGDESVTEGQTVPQDLGTEQYKPTMILEPIVTDKPAISHDGTVAQEEPEVPVTAQPEPSVQPDVIPTQPGTEQHTPYDATTQRFDEESPKITTSAPQATEFYETPSSMSPTVEQTVTEGPISATESEQETIKPDQLNKNTVSEEPAPITNAPAEAPITSEEPSAAPITPATSDDRATAKPELPSDDKTQSTPVSPADEEPKPVVSDELPGAPTGPGDLPSPGEDVDHQSPDQFPSPGYGAEPDYEEEDQAFGPGTCRYGGKVYVSAQQIPRDDPCDFCFCFRSDIICLQQSCPPPIHGCHEEPINGFCCPRYECPVSMATTLNVTTTTTTTTTTLPPHFLPHAYKGAAQRRGCHIKGHSYQVGEVVRASSGPCLHCTCGGDGQMKCDPKVCTPEPMLRQMIAAAVSTKRRR